MAKDAKTRRRKPTKRKYKPERRVVSVRFDPAIFADIKAEADAYGVTITDIIHRRLVGCEAHRMEIENESVDLAKEDAQEIDRELEAHPELAGDRKAAWRQLERKGLEIELRELGYTCIAAPGGTLWAEPDATIPVSIIKTLMEPKA